ncbi:hypothetical protein ABT56_00850 [Photobacterium aquae]|uniref:HTH deoR-type domain-containing protein n=1 Tax=Photobacterium aquae TaxID=1195763 RepID=A0A0J1HB01_9GAMM|nr:DNA-binding transcriptional repressor DeoR [Photobacterium aquae]KLV08809.1 hypothetical protein ABT56_00850 [Photobacterium aquae]
MTETKQEKRLRQLVELMQGIDKVHLRQAADSLEVSEMTLRRDLYSPHPTLAVIGGYIINKQSRNDTEYELYVQSENNVREKSFIGKQAAKLVKPNDTVFFDNGTTIVHIIHAIPDDMPFTGVCFSLNVLTALRNKSNCQAILCGGQFEPRTNHFYPLSAQTDLDHIRFDLMFCSAAGVDAIQGLTCHELTELPYKHRALRQSRHRVLVVDSSKLGRVRRAAICGLEGVDDVLCDEELPQEWYALIGRKK